MECIQVHGGIPLRGKLEICGAKNAALPLMVAGLLTDQVLQLDNVPKVSDIATLRTLLEVLGTTVHDSPSGYRLQTLSSLVWRAPYDLVRRMRASILTLGAMLGRFGHGEVSLPGGCAIGVRPLDFHLDGMRALGASVDVEHGYIVAKAPGGRLPGGRYVFPKVSVTGTQNLIFAAVLARGESCLVGAAVEPEIADLIACLQAMGACIEGAGTPTLRIQGCQSLGGACHKVMPDRIEMGTFMVAAAITQGDLVLSGGDLAALPTVVSVLAQSGALVQELDGGDIRVRMQGRPQPFSLVTQPYPGFPTDLQAQFMALAALADGTSSITETIYENRYMHVAELARMGAIIHMDGHHAHVHGQSQLAGAHVMATDLRASVSLVLAALAAQGETIIHRPYHLDRGYERLEQRLAACGAKIARIPTPTPQESPGGEVVAAGGFAASWPGG
jgi:UDP-N-acetylglucosamine 1-carboxyvinyltransferase